MTYKQDQARWAKEREGIADLHSQGFSIRDIAKKLGVTDSAVWARLNRFKNEKPNQSL